MSAIYLKTDFISHLYSVVAAIAAKLKIFQLRAGSYTSYMSHPVCEVGKHKF